MNKSTETLSKNQISASLFDEREILLPDDNDKLIFKNQWGKKLSKPQPTLQLKGVTCGKYNSWTLIKAQAGVGKTSLIMALASSWVSGDEHLGFRAISQNNLTKVLIIDTEQPENDSQDAYNQIWQRLGYKEGDEIDKNLLNKIVHLGLSNISSDIPRMMQVVEETLKKNNDIGLICFDVGSDFCESVNDMYEVRKFVLWLKRIQATIVITWHINEGRPGMISAEGTARGHGKELQRKCSYTITMTMLDELGSIKLDKNRKGEKPLLQYVFSEDHGYFIETDQEPKTKKDTSTKYIKIVNDIFNFHNKDILTFMEMVESVEKIRNCGRETAKTFVKRSLMQLLNKEGDNGYSINNL